MTKLRDVLGSIDAIVSDAVKHGLVHRIAEDDFISGETIRLNGVNLLNFASCSYLGLEVDSRLKEGAIRAAEKFGTQFSSSRAYVSAPPYLELERLLEQLFGRPTHMATTCLLGDLSALPILIDESDAVLFDQQVHHTVQTALHQIRTQGTHVELLKHNDLQKLEERVSELEAKHPQVWYLADGVYSMFGDTAPLRELKEILNRH